MIASGLSWMITAYRTATKGRPPTCRYSPTCSEYALEAIEIHGAGRGSWLATRRISRCHPLGGKGWDPVPDLDTISPPRTDEKESVSTNV